MNWHSAFLRQARSEDALRRRLNEPQIEYSHRLHYLQMVTEKLAKAYQVRAQHDDPPPISHNAFVRLLQTLKKQSAIRKQLGFTDAMLFRQYIDSMLDLADRIEGLAPSRAGLNQPNPEYPWQDRATSEIWTPVDFAFPQFSPTTAAMIRLERLIQDLLRIA